MCGYLPEVCLPKEHKVPVTVGTDANMLAVCCMGECSPGTVNMIKMQS